MEEGALRNAAASLRARAARGSSPSLVAAAARLETLVEEMEKGGLAAPPPAPELMAPPL